MGDVEKITDPMATLREIVRDEKYKSWVLVGLTDDDFWHLGVSSLNPATNSYMLQKGLHMVLDEGMVPDDDA